MLSRFVVQGAKNFIPFTSSSLDRVIGSYITQANLDKSSIQEKLEGVWEKLKHSIVGPNDPVTAAVIKIAKALTIALPIAYMIWEVSHFTSTTETSSSPIWAQYGIKIVYLFALQFFLETLYTTLYPEKEIDASLSDSRPTVVAADSSTRETVQTHLEETPNPAPKLSDRSTQVIIMPVMIIPTGNVSK